MLTRLDDKDELFALPSDVKTKGTVPGATVEKTESENRVTVTLSGSALADDAIATSKEPINTTQARVRLIIVAIV